ncbi:hypothetical protein [Kribbella pratensis]|uniref:hypothetical protein n=1 Tax=Kribbella pratensis TaxID=2512112 RepID=UPI001416EE95|nr:hypothetical protein [Kribbella pratensis]
MVGSGVSARRAARRARVGASGSAPAIGCETHDGVPAGRRPPEDAYESPEAAGLYESPEADDLYESPEAADPYESPEAAEP